MVAKTDFFYLRRAGMETMGLEWRAILTGS